jgi:hypothetical protein
VSSDRTRHRLESGPPSWKEDAVQHPKDPRPIDPRRPLRHRIDPYAASCPLGGAWREWDFFNASRRSPTGDALARDHAARNAIGVRDLGERALDWEVAFDDPGRLIHEAGGDPSGSHPWSGHVHAETRIDGVRVHIDWVAMLRFGPGRSLTEVRIYADGLLAGRAWQGGCSLGAGEAGTSRRSRSSAAARPWSSTATPSLSSRTKMR